MINRRKSHEADGAAAGESSSDDDEPIKAPTQLLVEVSELVVPPLTVHDRCIIHVHCRCFRFTDEFLLNL